MTLGTLLKLATAVGAYALIASSLVEAMDKSGHAPGVSKNGSIQVPNVDFRKEWSVLGAWVVNGDDGENAKGIHNVYTQPSTIDAYRKTGKFPDGAVLVKELLTTKTQDMTTGTIGYADKIEGWFVMVKDTKGRFPDNKLWGDGWGWAFFKGGNRAKTTSTDYEADCKGCHIPARKTDWIYTQAYPVLKGK